jgi:hypothetical protein
MSVNYCRLVSMTDEEKRKMYKKNTKKQLIDMLIASSNANELLYDEIQKLTRISLGNKQPIYTNINGTVDFSLGCCDVRGECSSGSTEDIEKNIE